MVLFLSIYLRFSNIFTQNQVEKLEIVNPESPEMGTHKLLHQLTSESLSYNSSVYVMYNLDDESGQYIFMSPAIKELTGYSRQELNTYGFRSIVKEVYSKKVDRYNINGEKNLIVEEFYAKYLIETIDDKLKWVEDNSFSYIDENGERTNTVGILRDNSALQNFINELNEEKNNLDSIFDLSDTMLIQLDMDLNISLINQKGARIFDGKKEDIVGRKLEEFVLEEEQTDFHIFMDKLASGKKGTAENTIGRIVSIANEVKTIEWHNALIKDKTGKIISIISSGQEITERKKEDKIRTIISNILEESNSEKNLNEIFKFIHNSIGKLMKAENFYIAYYNKSQNLISYPYFVDKYDDGDVSPAKFGKGLTEYIIKTGKSALVDKKMDNQLMKKGEVELLGPQSEIWLGVPLKIQNTVIGAMVVQDYEDVHAYDKTDQQIMDVVAYPISRAIERKMVEADREKLIIQLKELNKSKDQLFSLISHDLRNPFNSLLGFAEIMTSEYDSLTREELKEYLAIMNESAKNLFGMTNNLLHYSRYQLGKFKYQPRNLNLEASVRAALESQKSLIKKKDLLFTINIHKQFFIHADEDLLTITLDNLISNAIKFSDTGGSITISAEEFATGNKNEQMIKLIIHDEGTGISEENLIKIENREMFSTPGTNREFGAGLGLSLSKDFIKMNKGEFGIESDGVSGTTVNVVLPLSRNSG